MIDSYDQQLNNKNLTTPCNTQGKAYFGNLLLACSGGYREGETPGSIPNPEAKTLFAHNTASFRCGNVGRRQAARFFIIQPITNNKPTKQMLLNTIR